MKDLMATTEDGGARQPDNGGPLRVYLVRHGATAWSLSKRHTGTTDITLTPHGEEQALALAPVLSGTPFAHVLTSPAVRARRTSELAGFARRAVVIPDLAEWDYGDYEGKLSSDIRQTRPDWSVYQNGCPGGESVRDVSDRADRVIASLHAYTGNVLLFSHGQFGCSLAVRWIGLAIAQAQHLQLDPASISELAFNPDNPGLAVLAQWNSAPAMTPQQMPVAEKKIDA